MRLPYIQCQNLSKKFKSSLKILKHTTQDIWRNYWKILGSHISFSEEMGKEILIYFIDMANFIINKNFREKTQDINTESERIIKTAATLDRDKRSILQQRLLSNK